MTNENFFAKLRRQKLAEQLQPLSAVTNSVKQEDIVTTLPVISSTAVEGTTDILFNQIRHLNDNGQEYSVYTKLKTRLLY